MRTLSLQEMNLDSGDRSWWINTVFLLQVENSEVLNGSSEGPVLEDEHTPKCKLNLSLCLREKPR